jgi:hypothetical protein
MAQEPGGRVNVVLHTTEALPEMKYMDGRKVMVAYDLEFPNVRGYGGTNYEACKMLALALEESVKNNPRALDVQRKTELLDELRDRLEKAPDEEKS